MDRTNQQIFLESRTEGVLFEHMGLDQELLAGIRAKKFYLPSPIQEESIPAILKRRNILARAKNGTGKTASYLIPIIQIVEAGLRKIQVIIVVPTRELAFQTCTICQDLSKYTRVKSYVLTGGKHVSEDLEEIQNGAHILISTFGRLYYFAEKNLIDLSLLSVIVFDEADSILQSQDTPLMDLIIKKSSPDIQIVLFSATFPMIVANFKEKYMNNALEINTMREFTLKGVSQFYAFVEEKNKMSCIYVLLSKLTYKQCIIFCNSVTRVNLLTKKLQELTIDCQSIHSKMTYHQRLNVYNDFKSKKFPILVCSDIFYRGIDVPDVNIVINFDFPPKSSTYLHRIGRSGRFGQRGLGISFVSTHDKDDYQRICRELKAKIDPIPLGAKIPHSLYV